VAAETPWTPFEGGEAQETKIREATAGLADVRTVRAAAQSELRFEPHEGELVFGFVLDGSAQLGSSEIGAADAFVTPPGQPWALSGMSADFRLLHVTTASLDAAASSPL